MKELGLDGSSLNSLVKGPAEQAAGLAANSGKAEEPKQEPKAKQAALPSNGGPKDGAKPADA